MDDKYSPRYRLKYQKAIDNGIKAIFRKDKRRLNYWIKIALKYQDIAAKIYEAEWKFKLRVANKLNGNFSLFS